MARSDQPSSNEMFRIRWDGSKKIVDLSNAFQNFRDNQELLDVSLVCSISDGGSTSLRAHKLLLAAYSPVFKDMLTRSDEKNNPCVYLKGVSQESLSLILDFVYEGVVDVPKSRMNEFLADAQELQIQGLKSETEPKAPINIDKPKASSTPASNQSKPKASKKRVKKEPEEPVQENGINLQGDNAHEKSCSEFDGGNSKRDKRTPKKNAKLEQEMSLSMEHSIFSENRLGSYMPSQEFSNLNGSKLSDPNDSRLSGLNDSIASNEKSRIEEIFEKVPDKWQGTEAKKKYFVRCKLCSKELRSDKKAKHLRANHPN